LLDLELIEGLTKLDRSNIFHTYPTIRDLLTGIQELTDASTFNPELGKGELKEKKEKTNATFDVD